MKISAKVFSTLLFGFLMFTFTNCFASLEEERLQPKPSLPDSEFALGGITLGVSKDYVISVYGEPQSRGYKGDCFTYGDEASFTIVFINNKADIIEVSANNGITTPSGFRVGMNISNVIRKYPKAVNLQPDMNTWSGYSNGDKWIMEITVPAPSYSMIKKIKIRKLK